MKILAYNSSARGAGQYIRSLKIAKILTEYFLDANFLILVGNSYLEKSLPVRTEIIALPKVFKSLDGVPQTQLTNLQEVFLIRKALINSVIENYNPDAFIVDSRPSGLNGELIDILKLLKKRKTKSILMLRDIVDSPEIVIKQWKENNYYSLVEDLYDKIIVLGDKYIFDATYNYRFEKFDNKVLHIGYIGNLSKPNIKIENENRKKEALVTVGGGYDGEKIINTICQLISTRDIDLKFNIVLGGNTCMNIGEILNEYNLSSQKAEFYVHIDKIENLILNSEFAVCMAGYNTIYELMEMRKKMVVIPRNISGKEQLIRVDLISKYYDGIWSIPMDTLSLDTLNEKIENVLKSKKPEKRLVLSGKQNLINFFETEIL